MILKVSFYQNDSAILREEKEVPVTSASEFQPGIRNQEYFPNCCADSGVQYGRVQLNAINQMGLGGIYRGPVWKSGLSTFVAAVSQPYTGLQHVVVLCVHAGFERLGEQLGPPGLDTGDMVWRGHRVGWPWEGSMGWEMTWEDSGVHQEPNICGSDPNPLAHEIMECEYPLAFGRFCCVLGLLNAN